MSRFIAFYRTGMSVFGGTRMVVREEAVTRGNDTPYR